ncbi:type I restriction endonuclease subunit R [Proteiniclasticum sp. SCR006]|uniref:Type I restriction enzyme endonuclease subunit n=2 Tax=Proteiniclasticum aestuarii TaxID=2817862 RepID=A0A939H5E3_9CLOT|nr:type I restriction endonuclease subunit R [Proteiniclasticum aestuarii]
MSNSEQTAGYQSEAQLEALLVKNLIRKDYERVEIRDRDDLEANFRQTLYRFNESKLNGKPFSNKEFEKILLHIEGKSIYQSAKNLRDQFVLTRDDGTEVYIGFMSDEHTDNIYQVTNQVTMIGKYTNRYDVTLLMNGLPVCQIELKRRGMDMKAAFNQIMRYRRHSFAGLYRYVQLFVISNGVDTKYFSNNDGEINYGNTFFWTDESNNRISTLQDFADSFFNRYFLTKILSKYFVINDTDKMLMVMRPYQIFATEALVKKATETLSNGYVWHTTGAGKTLTSFKASQLIAQDNQVKKVFFLVDRKDLDTQTTQEFNKFEAGSVDTTDSTKVLVKQIKDPQRKLIITTIQKLAHAVNSARYEKVLSQYSEEKVIFIIDECHRSQFGDMHKDIKKHFTKAQYFGFTGTPRFIENKSQDGRTTTDIFGKCLHTYLIKEAIHDNNVLGFNVEYIQTFTGQYDESDDAMVEGIDTKEVYEDPERISLVANHIVNHHHMKTRNKQYTALFTVASIPMLIKYYDMFKTIQHNLKITAVFTFGQNEDAEGKDEHSRESLERIIKDYNKEFGTNYSTDTFSAFNTDVSKRVKTKQIDILIVVNMYTTGFDSKPLSTLYVDKRMKFHDLLQAFSRTNRVELATKPYGNIVCYRNLKERTDEAIKLFSQTDSVDDVLLREYSYYLDKFQDAIGDLHDVVKTPADVDNLMSEDDQKKFIIAFRELSKLLLILQSFVEFEFDPSVLHITEQTYQDFRSKYLDLHEESTRTSGDKATILDDIDFSIELMHTDRINVAYIMNLIRNINFEDDEKKKKDVEYIKKELDRTDNPQLRKKVDLIKAFLDEVIPNVSPEDNVDDEYFGFENRKRDEEITEFSEEKGVDVGILTREISELEFTGIFNKERIRENLGSGISFLKKKSLLEEIKNFIYELVEKYQ